jgi:hypothetical protein
MINDLKPYPEYNTASSPQLISSLRKSALSVDEISHPQIPQRGADLQIGGLA